MRTGRVPCPPPSGRSTKTRPARGSSATGCGRLRTPAPWPAGRCSRCARSSASPSCSPACRSSPTRPSSTHPTRRRFRRSSPVPSGSAPSTACWARSPTCRSSWVWSSPLRELAIGLGTLFGFLARVAAAGGPAPLFHALSHHQLSLAPLLHGVGHRVRLRLDAAGDRRGGRRPVGRRAARASSSGPAWVSSRTRWCPSPSPPCGGCAASSTTVAARHATVRSVCSGALSLPGPAAASHRAGSTRRSSTGARCSPRVAPRRGSRRPSCSAEGRRPEWDDCSGSSEQGRHDAHAWAGPPRADSRRPPSTTAPSSVRHRPTTTSTTAAASHPPGTKVGPAEDVPVGGAASFQDPSSGDPSLVVQPVAGTFVAFDAVCPHAGCTVAYSSTGRLFICPCHGSEFNGRTGAVEVGPATPRPDAAGDRRRARRGALRGSEAGRCAGYIEVMPTMGAFRCWPPMEPRNGASPKVKMPPSPPWSQ